MIKRAATSHSSDPARVRIHRAFENEMNIAVHATHKAFESLLFREALKAGYYELQDARDRYRLACGFEGMRHDLALRYIEVRARVCMRASRKFHICGSGAGD